MKQKLLKIAKNRFGWSLIVQTFIKLCATALGLYTTSWLILETTQAQYAEYSVIINYVTVVQGLITLGLPRLIQKFYTSNEDESKVADFWTTFTFLRFASYILGLLVICSTFYLSTSSNLGLIIALFTIQFTIVVDETFRAICDAKGRTWQYSLTDFVERSVFVSFLVIYAVLDFANELDALSYFIIISLITRTLVILTDGYIQRQFIGWSKISWQIIKQNLKAIQFLSLSGLLVALFTSTRQIILSWSGASDIDIGTFFNANKLFTVALIVPGMTIPMVSSLVKKRLNKNQTGWLSLKLIKILHINNSLAIILEFMIIIFLFSIILYLGIIILAPLGLYLIDMQGKYSWEMGTDYLRIMSLSVLVLPSTVMIANLLIFGHKEKYEFISALLVAVFSIVTYTILSSQFKGYGIAWATVVIFIFDFVVKFALLLRMFRTETLAGRTS